MYTFDQFVNCCYALCATGMQVFLVHALFCPVFFSFRGGWYDKCFIYLLQCTSQYIFTANSTKKSL